LDSSLKLLNPFGELTAGLGNLTGGDYGVTHWQRLGTAPVFHSTSATFLEVKKRHGATASFRICRFIYHLTSRGNARQKVFF
jgi:hypothetical protein